MTRASVPLDIGLSLSFNSALALIFTLVANFLSGWIVSATGKFTCYMEGPNFLSFNRCYGLQPFLTALEYIKSFAICTE